VNTEPTGYLHPKIAEVVVCCRVCGAIGYRDDKYCACCGTPLSRTCGNCGAEIEHPAITCCVHCGTSFPTGQNGIGILSGR